MSLYRHRGDQTVVKMRELFSRLAGRNFAKLEGKVVKLSPFRTSLFSNCESCPFAHKSRRHILAAKKRLKCIEFFLIKFNRRDEILKKLDVFSCAAV